MKYLLCCALLAVPSPARADEPSPPSAPPVARPVRIALGGTSAVGWTHGRFFNQLVGTRLDYRFTPRFALGAVLSYASLKGKDRRVHNVLTETSLEYRLPIHGESFGAPLRFSAGYLPMNGPTLRLGAGLDFALSEALSLDFIPLEPMVWVTRERPEVSLNVSLALRAAF